MHALVVTFRSSIPTDALAEPFKEFARGLAKVPGFRTKAWLESGDTLGGFYLFDDEQSVNAYLTSPMVADLRATEGFDDFDVRAYGVIESLSAMTGIDAGTPA